jgi:two-component system response regulator HydG
MTRHALVVDDNAMLARTLSDILRLDGWEVTVVTTGAEAVRRVMDRDFDVVLMDIKMPGINGVDAFRAMRMVRPRLRVVLMSAYTAPDLIADAERDGLDLFLPKPVDPRALLALLERGHREDRSVLVVDGDAAFLRTLSDVLRQEGYETVVADGVTHATRLLADHRPVAVLLHLHLPDATAREALHRLHEASPRAPLIVYSGRPEAERETREAAPGDAVHRFLPKPFAGGRVAELLRGLRDSA